MVQREEMYFEPRCVGSDLRIRWYGEQYSAPELERHYEETVYIRDSGKELKKKLKGKYEKDTETLMKLVGLSEQEASDWAYLASEVINWEWMLQILKAAEWGGTPQEAVEVIRAAIFVDEGIKVTVEAEK